MTNLKQRDVAASLIHLVKVRYLIDDGYHNKELLSLIRISNTLYDELDDENKIKFQKWLGKKMKEHESE